MDMNGTRADSEPVLITVSDADTGCVPAALLLTI